MVGSVYSSKAQWNHCDGSSKVRKSTHKYGLEIATSVEDVSRIDKKNGNMLWQDALNKEVKNAGIAFKILEKDENVPRVNKKLSGHLIYDIKMDFTWKVRWVKDGHKTPNSETSSYAGIMSQDSIRIMLMHAALHRVGIVAADIRNAYLQALTSEKHFIICREEFGIMVRLLEETFGTISAIVDPDIWIQKVK